MDPADSIEAEQTRVAAEDAEREEALRAALLTDEVYLVTAVGRHPRVFGHEDDAEAYASKTAHGTLSKLRVLDRADARTLIEGERT